jgi:hypothetical protein
MLGLFRRRQRRETPRVRRAPLTLERLESRDVPSTLTLSITPSGIDKTVTVSGEYHQDLASNEPGQLCKIAALNTNHTIHLGGVVNGTAVADASGHFIRTLLATGLGAATAWADDGSSNVATATLVVKPPTIDTLRAVEEPTDWVFSGHATGYNPGSLTITLTGLGSVKNITVTVQANGNFTTSVHLDGTANDDGWLRAVTTDVWGQTSNRALYLVHQTH